MALADYPGASLLLRHVVVRGETIVHPISAHRSLR